MWLSQPSVWWALLSPGTCHVPRPVKGKGRVGSGVSFCSLKGIPHSKDRNSGTVQLAGTGVRSSCDLYVWGRPAFRDSGPWLCGSQCLRGAAGNQVTFQKGQGRVGGAVMSFSQPCCGPWTSHPLSVGLSVPVLPSKPSDPDVPKVSTFSLSLSFFLSGSCRTMSFRH